MPNSTLAPLPSEVFIERLADTRERKRLTQQQLADRLKALDAPIDRSTIGKIESGKRGVSLDELFYFAAALGISPLALLVPRADTRMRVAPAFEAATKDIVLWARNVFALWPPHIDHDESDERFFANEAITDEEARAYREQPTLIAMTKVSAALLGLAASGKPRDAELLKKSARILSQLALQLVADVDRESELASLTGQRSESRTRTRTLRTDSNRSQAE